MKKHFKIVLVFLVGILLSTVLLACNKKDIVVNFEVDGEVFHTIDTKGKETIKIPDNPTKEGFTFEGWYFDKDIWQNAITSDSFLETKLKEGISVYAKWRTNSYTVTANKNIDSAGTVEGGGTKEYNSSVTLTATTNAGYTWQGWYAGDTKVSTDNELTYTFAIPAEDKTFEARWTLNQYTITFDSNNGSEVTPITQNFGSNVTAPANPTRDGYTFDNWYTDDSTFENAYTFSTIPLEGITLYAKWTVNKYAINFVSNNGSEVSAITQDFGSNVTEPENPIREGYTFDDWYTDNGTFENAYTFSTIPLNGITIYANWTPNIYTIFFVSNNGSEVSPKIQDFGSDVTAPANPTRDGYVFDDWYEDGDTFETPYTFTTMPFNGAILYANWIANSGTVIFNANGGLGEMNNVNLTTGNSIPNNQFSKENYIFVGWALSAAGDKVFSDGGYIVIENDSDDVTLYAQWAFCKRTNLAGEPTADGDYLLFGEYPQTLKAENVTISTTTDIRGYFLGDDGYFYAKVSTSYFKVEPIKWRILQESDGTALILCESIIANKRYDADNNNYADSEIRAWLNDGFYNPAFSASQKALIRTTEVDNSVYSTVVDPNEYACENTDDKIFLPSYREMINTEYGFVGSNPPEGDTARTRQRSDYAVATGATQYSYWWLRSPSHQDYNIARFIINNGHIFANNVNNASYGVVPALRIHLPQPDA